MYIFMERNTSWYKIVKILE